MLKTVVLLNILPSYFFQDPSINRKFKRTEFLNFIFIVLNPNFLMQVQIWFQWMSQGLR